MSAGRSRTPAAEKPETETCVLPPEVNARASPAAWNDR